MKGEPRGGVSPSPVVLSLVKILRRPWKVVVDTACNWRSGRARTRSTGILDEGYRDPGVTGGKLYGMITRPRRRVGRRRSLDFRPWENKRRGPKTEGRPVPRARKTATPSPENYTHGRSAVSFSLSLSPGISADRTHCPFSFIRIRICIQCVYFTVSVITADFPFRARIVIIVIIASYDKRPEIAVFVRTEGFYRPRI